MDKSPLRSPVRQALSTEVGREKRVEGRVKEARLARSEAAKAERMKSRVRWVVMFKHMFVDGDEGLNELVEHERKGVCERTRLIPVLRNALAEILDEVYGEQDEEENARKGAPTMTIKDLVRCERTESIDFFVVGPDLEEIEVNTKKIVGKRPHEM